MNKLSDPIQMRTLLNNCVENPSLLPPISTSAYIVTLNKWKGQPVADSFPLYAGGNSKNTDRFRTRVGDLIADMLGFYGGGTGHHSGGKALHAWCQSQLLNPLDLYISWVIKSPCFRCAEIELYEKFKPSLN